MFDADREPLSSSAQMSQEDRFTLNARLIIGLHYMLRDIPDWFVSSQADVVSVTPVVSRPGTLHVHAKDQLGRPIDHVVTVQDFASWSQRVARELWAQGFYRMPSIT
jgi:hypothetical protein